jgi:hypothetical protein
MTRLRLVLLATTTLTTIILKPLSARTVRAACCGTGEGRTGPMESQQPPKAPPARPAPPAATPPRPAPPAAAPPRPAPPAAAQRRGPHLLAAAPPPRTAGAAPPHVLRRRHPPRLPAPLATPARLRASRRAPPLQRSATPCAAHAAPPQRPAPPARRRQRRRPSHRSRRPAKRRACHAAAARLAPGHRPPQAAPPSVVQRTGPPVNAARTPLRPRRMLPSTGETALLPEAVRWLVAHRRRSPRRFRRPRRRLKP